VAVAQSKVPEFLQKRAMNIIFPGGEYATNLTISNVIKNYVKTTDL